MPPKEGERGKDQHLAVETLPPRVILCTRKMKAIGKRWLSWVSVESVAQALQHLQPLTQKTCFHLRERFPSHLGLEDVGRTVHGQIPGARRTSHMQVCFAPVYPLR